MNDITEQEVAIVKAATAGFAQALILRGVEPEVVKQATIAYADRENGMLQKRAANRALIAKGIDGMISYLRAQQA